MDRRAQPVLVVVKVALLVERHAACRVDAPLAQDAAVGGVRLGCLVCGEFTGHPRPPGRPGHDAAGERVGVDRESAILVEGFDCRAAKNEGNAGVGVGAGDFIGIGVNGRDARCPSAPGFALDGGEPVAGDVGVASSGAADERHGSVLDEVAGNGAGLVRVGGSGVVPFKRRVVADRGDGREPLAAQPLKDVLAVERIGVHVAKNPIRAPGAVVLVERQHGPSPGVVGAEPPRTGVAAFEPDVPVALRVVVVRVVRRERLVPVAAPVLLGVVRLADDGVGERPEPLRLRCRVRKDRAGRVADDPLLALPALIVDVAA